MGSVLAINGDKKMVLQKSYFAGPSFFNLFSYPLIGGDPNTALKDVFSAVITETVAKKLFGTTDAVGKTFKFDVNIIDNRCNEGLPGKHPFPQRSAFILCHIAEIRGP